MSLVVVFLLHRLGVSGVLDKGTDSVDDLSRAIQQVGAGKSYHSRSYGDTLATLRASGALLDHYLSQQEFHLLQFVAAGCSDEVIADRCSTSLSKVVARKKRIRRKLGLSTNRDLVFEARRMGFWDSRIEILNLQGCLSKAFGMARMGTAQLQANLESPE